MAVYDLESLKGWFGAENVGHRSLDAEETLFHQGEPSRYIHFVLEGEIRAETFMESGSSIVFFRAHPGAALGEENMHFPEYLYSAIASVPTQVRYVPTARLLELFRTDSDFAESLLRCLAKRFGDALMLRELMAVRSAEHRLRVWLRWHVPRESGGIDLAGRMGSLGADLGLSRESVYRSLAKLESKGEIKRHAGKIHLVDAPPEPSTH